MWLKNLLETGKVEEVQGALNQPIEGLTYDSRKVSQGDVFLPCRGRTLMGMIL